MAKFLWLYNDHIININRVNQIYLDFRYDELHKRPHEFKWCFKFDTQIVKSKTFESGKEAFAWFETHVLPLINETG